jgi:hypothetical protein
LMPCLTIVWSSARMIRVGIDPPPYNVPAIASACGPDSVIHSELGTYRLVYSDFKPTLAHIRKVLKALAPDVMDIPREGSCWTVLTSAGPFV